MGSWKPRAMRLSYELVQVGLLRSWEIRRWRGSCLSVFSSWLWGEREDVEGGVYLFRGVNDKGVDTSFLLSLSLSLFRPSHSSFCSAAFINSPPPTEQIWPHFYATRHRSRMDLKFHEISYSTTSRWLLKKGAAPIESEAAYLPFVILARPIALTTPFIYSRNGISLCNPAGWTIIQVQFISALQNPL